MNNGRKRTFENGGFSDAQKLYISAKVDFEQRQEDASREYPQTGQPEYATQVTAANEKYGVAAAAREVQNAKFLLCLWGTLYALAIAERQQRPPKDLQAL